VTPDELRLIDYGHTMTLQFLTVDEGCTGGTVYLANCSRKLTAQPNT